MHRRFDDELDQQNATAYGERDPDHVSLAARIIRHEGPS